MNDAEARKIVIELYVKTYANLPQADWQWEIVEDAVHYLVTGTRRLRPSTPTRTVDLPIFLPP